MIPIEKQVVSLELAKELKEAGINKDSYFYWVEHKRIEEPDYKDCMVLIDKTQLKAYMPKFWNIYSAYLTSELIEALKEYSGEEKQSHDLRLITPDNLAQWWLIRKKEGLV